MTLKSAIKFNQDNTYLGLSDNGYGRTFFATRDFNAGEVVVIGMGKVITHQTSRVSIQIGLNKHFQPTKWTGRYWNHSCNPNAYVKTRSDGFPSLVAARKIKQDEEIVYSYFMTEYSWCYDAEEQTVACKCNDKKCKGKILSFLQLPKSRQQTLVKSGKCSLYLKGLL